MTYTVPEEYHLFTLVIIATIFVVGIALSQYRQRLPVFTKKGGRLVLSNKGQSQSGRLEIDQTRKMVFIASLQPSLIHQQEKYRFDELDCLKVDVDVVPDMDDGEDSFYILELLDKNQHCIWSCSARNSRDTYISINTEICKALDIDNHSKVFQITQCRCKQCDRMISRYSKFCLYCGAKPSNDPS